MSLKPRQFTPFNISIRNNFQYGDLGIVLSLHGELYHREYGFDHHFEAYVAAGLAEFAQNYHTKKSSLWIAESKNNAIGTIAILERPHHHAQLRWFLIVPDFRGLKLGRHLLKEAVQFCRDCGYKEIFLWTLDQLEAAKAIYLGNGFKLVERKESHIWGKHLIEERYILKLQE